MDRDNKPPRRNVTTSNPRSKPRQSLPIRTGTQSSPPAMQQVSTPLNQQYPVYPLPIPKEKRPRAVELYKQYCDAHLTEKVENSHLEPQSAASHHDGYHLSLPRPPTAHSVTSYTSSKYSLASGYDAVTDLSSVVSFDNEEEPTFAATKAEGELLSFDGRKIKQRRRKRLSPVARAKAALVRHLGSCWVCRSRRVKCPLEHHDIDTLERLRQERLARPRGDHNSGSSVSSSSQQTATSVSRLSNTGPGVSQTDALMGIGENPDISRDLGQLGNLDTTQLDIASPGDAVYPDILLDVLPQNPPLHVVPDLPDFGPNPYTNYQDGSMMAIGVQRGSDFYCQHLGDFCDAFYSTSEELQTHFEIDHFPFTRIHPAHRYICSECNCLNNDIIGPCSSCTSAGTIEVWIYGNFIRNLFFQRHAPDPQGIADLSPAGLFSNASFSFSDAGDGNWGQGGSYGGYTNTDNSGFPGGNSFGGSQFEYQPSNHSSYSTNHFQGSTYGGARQMACGSSPARIVLGKAQSTCHSYSLCRPFLCLLLITILLGFSHAWAFAVAQQAVHRMAMEFQTHLRLVGFLGMVVSSGPLRLLKPMTTQRLRHARSFCSTSDVSSHFSVDSSRNSQRPLRKLAKARFDTVCRQTSPFTFGRGCHFS